MERMGGKLEKTKVCDACQMKTIDLSEFFICSESYGTSKNRKEKSS
jgi:hypothetical protein